MKIDLIITSIELKKEYNKLILNCLVPIDEVSDIYYGYVPIKLYSNIESLDMFKKHILKRVICSLSYSQKNREYYVSSIKKKKW